MVNHMIAFIIYNFICQKGMDSFLPLSVFK